MEYLGFWVTRDVVKPINRKKEAITNMAPNIYRKLVRKFMGIINYYLNMWSRRSHQLAPLTGLTYIKRKVKWTQVEKYAFDEIERIASHITLLTYMYFNETFKMHTDTNAL